MKTATKIRDIEGWRGRASLYKLDPPIEDEPWGDEPKKSFGHVVVSATIAMFSGPETYIFGAGEDGEVISWSELPGSYRGGLSHAEALQGAGYSVEL